MSNILRSASKLVFIGLMFTACAGFLSGILPVDQFMILAIASASFYFSKPVPDAIGGDPESK